MDVSNKRGFDIDLLLRWFQFGAFTSIFRVHGYRSPVITDTLPCSSDTRYSSGLGEPSRFRCHLGCILLKMPAMSLPTGLSPTSGHNEVYTFTAADNAEFNYSAAITKVVRLRESMRGYVGQLFANYSRTGEPVMRPMFYDFPTDRACATPAAGDQYMFGPRVLVAPITANCTADGLSCTSRHVYLPPLPGGEVWTNVFTNRTAAGGSNASVAGPRDTFPLFVRGPPSAIDEVFNASISPLAGWRDEDDRGK